MKKFLVFVPLLAMLGCTKSADPAKDPVNQVACALEGAAVSLVSGAVVTQLACKNLDAVKAGVGAIVAKSNICKPPATPSPAPAAAAAVSVKGSVAVNSAVGNILCAPIVEALMAGALTQIPADWQCSGGVPADKLKAAVLAACLKSL